MLRLMFKNKIRQSLRWGGIACATAAMLTNTGYLSAQPDAEFDGEVTVSPHLTVDIHVQDTDLAKVLQMLSLQSQKNIVASKNVSATVTADLYDVTFYEALDAILNANGYGYDERGNFIYVYTLEELQAIHDAAREVVSQRFELSYLNASDASAFITPLLSDEGTVAMNSEPEPGIDPDESNVGENTWSYAAMLVISDYPENISRIDLLLKDLDTRPSQVLVEATVLQTNLTEDNAFGMDWSLVADSNFSDFVNPLSPVDNLLSGSDPTAGFQPADNDAWGMQSTSGRTSGPGTLKVGVVSEDISIFLKVLDEVTDSTVLSRPKVLTLNRQRGEILIGRQIGYLSSTATETSTTQTVEFLDTGTQLIFRPFIAQDGFIRMELRPSVSEGIIREVTTAGGDAVTIPDRITQELTTNVMVRDGNTIILGGLFKEETTLSRRQVPILGDIPLLGAAFRGHEDTTRRSEIMFLITPTILKDEYMYAEGARAVEQVERARIAARKGTLWWSNDRLTAQHNMRAEQALREGNTELALWEIDRSLSLKADQPRVLELRDKATGINDTYFNRSLIDSIIDGAIEERHGLLKKAKNQRVELAQTETIYEDVSDHTVADASIDNYAVAETASVMDIQEDLEMAQSEVLQTSDSDLTYIWYDIQSAFGWTSPLPTISEIDQVELVEVSTSIEEVPTK